MKIPQIKIKYVGGVKNILTRSMFYFSLMNFIMISITSYTVVLSDVINVTFFEFVFILSACISILTIFEYCVMLPSELMFVNHQIYTHNNPIRNDLVEIREMLNELKQKKEGDKNER